MSIARFAASGSHKRVRTSRTFHSRSPTAIDDRDERIALRKTLQQQTARRLEQLEQLAQVELTAPKLIGRLRVLPAATPELAEDAQSEWVAMTHIQKLLEGDGWHVDDVHTEGRGYDLEARRNSQIRQVEVKGVAGDASSAVSG